MSMSFWNILALVLAFSACSAEALPHVDDCNFCEKCWYDESKGADTKPPEHPKVDGIVAAEWIAPTTELWKAKQAKPNCTECWGCSTQLEPLKSFQAFGHNFTVEAGASQEWLFYADLPDTHATGRKAIVKVWCVPVDKSTGRFKAVGRCEGAAHAAQGAQHLVAVDRLTADCGLHDITIKTWIAPVNAIIPGIGFHVFWYGLWMERAPGISMNQLAYVGKRDLINKLVLGLMQEKLNKTQITRAAVFDLMTGQCDRHAQNVFVDETGSIKLIDNINSFKLSWKWCSQDSIFLPGTQKFEIMRYGANIVTKRVAAKVRKSTNPLVLLDYRCYVPGGEMGTEGLPPDVKQCLTQLSGMSAVAIQEKYGFNELGHADMLKTRATDMITKGFEWTLKKGEPMNRPALRYKWHAPCCKLRLTEQRVVLCDPPFTEKIEMPLGDPMKGVEWDHIRSDPGLYDGADLWQDL